MEPSSIKETANACIAVDHVITNGVPVGQWAAAIVESIADGILERQGKVRGARYQVAKSGSEE